MMGFLALAEAKDEEFLLADLGVKIDPAGWRMDRWSDWDFRATSTDGVVVLAAWSTPLQTELGTDAAAWSPPVEARIIDFGARDPRSASASIEPGPPAVARQELSFSFPDGAKGTAYSATLVIAGANLHLATMTRAGTASRGKAALDRALRDLEIRKPPLEAPALPVSVGAHTIAPPPGFRQPLEAEADTVLAAVTAIVGEETAGCGWLLRPAPAAAPTLLLACPSRQHFGVLDSENLDEVAAEIAPRLFGKVEAPPAALIALPDRNGLVWKLPSGGRGVRMALVPSGDAAVRAWIAAPTDSPELDTWLKDALSATTWAEAHEPLWTEQVAYWTTYRTFSPQVLCPLLGLICPIGAAVIGGVAVVRARSRRHDASAPD